MQSIDRSKPILVTGATGYVAGWLVKKLLDEGLTVHAAVRDPNNTSKLQVLQNLADNSQGTIRFFTSDLLEEGSYNEAMQGCELVFHTASPFTVSVPDPQRDLVDPAVNGTRNVLASVNQTDSVKRVVLTSSVAGIYDAVKDAEDAPEGKFTEAVWNTRSSLTNNPYSYSKVQAEKAAWAIAQAQQRWDLVAINPGLVLGPAIGTASTSDSFAVLTQIGDGSMRSGAPAVAMAAVDVREVAQAHFAAAFIPEAEGRYIINGYDSNLFEMAQILHSRFGDRYPIPNKKVPKFLLWLIAPIVTKGQLSRQNVSRNVGIDYHFDNSKSIRELGIEYRPLEQTLADMFEYMIANNYFEAVN